MNKETKEPPKCPLCGKDMIIVVIDVVDGGEYGEIPIEGLVCEDEQKHIKEHLEAIRSK